MPDWSRMLSARGAGSGGACLFTRRASAPSEELVSGTMRDAADSWDISLPLNWHSNCNIAHEANCDEETKDSGAREKLHSNCDRVSAGTTMRHMSIAHRCGEQRKTHKNQKPRS